MRGSLLVRPTSVALTAAAVVMGSFLVATPSQAAAPGAASADRDRGDRGDHGSGGRADNGSGGRGDHGSGDRGDRRPAPSASPSAPSAEATESSDSTPSTDRHPPAESSSEPSGDPSAPASSDPSASPSSADPSTPEPGPQAPVLEVASERNHAEYERRVAEARTELDASLDAARAEYRRALEEADQVGTRRERDRKRREAKAEYRDAKREHRDDYERECGDAEELLLQAQVITFPSFGPVELGVTDGTLAATASSGLAVGYVVDTPAICEVAGAAVIGLDLGTCTITASQAGDGVTWAPATDVTVSVDVTEWFPPVAG